MEPCTTSACHAYGPRRRKLKALLWPVFLIHRLLRFAHSAHCRLVWSCGRRARLARGSREACDRERAPRQAMAGCLLAGQCKCLSPLYWRGERAMTAKDVKFARDARDRMLRGVEVLADAVRVTL